MARYRKKPVVIEAVRYDGTPECLIAIQNMGMDPVHESWEHTDPLEQKPKIIIGTLEGTMWASIGDWIIKGVNGEFYPCKPDIFEKTYEPVDGETDARETVSGEAIKSRSSTSTTVMPGKRRCLGKRCRRRLAGRLRT